jgi:hypothetical protein
MDKINSEALSNSAVVLEKIDNGTLTVKGKKPKVKADKKLETPPEVKEKPKPKKTETAVFPAAAKINDYGFLHFKNAWLGDLGWSKGMVLKVDKNADGSVTLTKA